MLQPNNACRKHLLILSLCQRKKNLQYEGNGYLQKICRSCKKNWQVRQKSKPKLLQGFISPLHFVVATQNTSNPWSQLFHK